MYKSITAEVETFVELGESFPGPAGLSPGPSFNSEAKVLQVDHDITRTHEARGGITNHYSYTMEDGFAYAVVEHTPHSPRSDTAVGIISPWGMHPGKGYLYDLSRQLSKVGYPVIAVGGEGSANPNGVSTIDQIRGLGHISLGSSAVNSEAIINHRIGQSDLRPGVILLGASRGQMTGLGLRNVHFGHYIDGCYYERPAMHGILELATKVSAPEVPTLIDIAVHQPEYLLSTSLNPREIAHQMLTWFALTSGDAAEVLKRSDPNTPTLITLMNRSRASQAKVQLELMKDRGQTMMEHVQGTHLTIAKSFMNKAIVLEMQDLSEMRGYDGDFSDDVDYSALFMAHHDRLGDRLISYAWL